MHTRDGFPGGIKALNGFEVPAEHFKVFRHTHPTAGEVVPGEHANRVPGTLLELVLLIGAPKLRVGMSFHRFVPSGQLRFKRL